MPYGDWRPVTACITARQFLSGQGGHVCGVSTLFFIKFRRHLLIDPRGGRARASRDLQPEARRLNALTAGYFGIPGKAGPAFGC